MKTKKENLVSPPKEFNTINHLHNTIDRLHEKWAKKNGYRENDILNSKNTVSFKDGAER